MDSSHSPNGPAGLAESLIATLEQERTALLELRSRFDRQIDALRTRDTDELETAALEVNQVSAGLNRLMQTRERQMRLIGRFLHLNTEQASLKEITDRLEGLEPLRETGRKLHQARENVLHAADQAHRRSEEVRFALRYAVQLGEELLQAFRGLDAPPPATRYTATGAAPLNPAMRALVDRKG